MSNTYDMGATLKKKQMIDKKVVSGQSREATNNFTHHRRLPMELSHTEQNLHSAAAQRLSAFIEQRREGFGCPAGQKVGVHTTHQQKGYMACVDLTLCQECPLLKEGKCLAQAGKRDGRLRVRFTQVEAQASQRRRRSKENKPRRATYGLP